MWMESGGDNKTCFRAVLIKWKQTCRKPYTWQTILDALSSKFVDQASLARDIEHQLVLEQPPIEGSGNVQGNYYYDTCK